MKATEAAALPVRPGEEPWTSGELAEVRKQLEGEIAAQREELRDGEKELAERLTDPVEGAGDDPADVGAKTFQREHDLALAYNTRDLLAKSERAIEPTGSVSHAARPSVRRVYRPFRAPPCASPANSARSVAD